MKAWIQRVSEASVDVGDQRVATIKRGLLILLGITQGDGPTDVAYLARKIPALRIFEDALGLMNLSLVDIEGELLMVSQFTLYADTRKGNRPSFTQAASPKHAEPLYCELARQLEKALGKGRVQTGIFGADMQVRLLNDGPVTIELCTDSTTKGEEHGLPNTPT